MDPLVMIIGIAALMLIFSILVPFSLIMFRGIAAEHDQMATLRSIIVARVGTALAGNANELADKEA